MRAKNLFLSKIVLVGVKIMFSSSADVSLFLPLCICITEKKFSSNFDEFFREGGGYVTSNSRIDFRDDPDHRTDTGIFKGIFFTSA